MSGGGYFCGVENDIGLFTHTGQQLPLGFSRNRACGNSVLYFGGVDVTFGTLCAFRTLTAAAAWGFRTTVAFATARPAGTTTSAATTALLAGVGEILVGGRFADPLWLVTRDLTDVGKQLQVINGYQRVGDAKFASATCAANAVNVVIRLPRQVKVEDVGDVRDIETTGGNVACR